MADTTQHTPPLTRLRAGLAATAEDAPGLLAALTGCPLLEPVAISGLPANSAPPGLKWYDDRRVMLAQGELQVAVLAGSTRSMLELSKAALEYGQHVWRPPPLGRDFAEAIDLVRQARDAKTLFRVASWWENGQAKVRELVRAADCVRPAFAEIIVNAEGPALASWRSSLTDAGGGVLLHEAYPLLEALLGLRGLPESVGAHTVVLRRGTGVPRETEDVTIALLRFEGGQTALVRAAWSVAPTPPVMILYGTNATVRIGLDRVQVLDANQVVQQDMALSPQHLADDLVAFDAALTAKQSLPQATLDRHLAVSAVCHAAYLSAKTGHPEIPTRLYEAEKWLVPT